MVHAVCDMTAAAPKSVAVAAVAAAVAAVAVAAVVVAVVVAVVAVVAGLGGVAAGAAETVAKTRCSVTWIAAVGMAVFAGQADIETVVVAAVVAEVGAEHMEATAETTAGAAAFGGEIVAAMLKIVEVSVASHFGSPLSAGAACEVAGTPCPEQAQDWWHVKHWDYLGLPQEVAEAASGKLVVDSGKVVSSEATRASP